MPNCGLVQEYLSIDGSVAYASELAGRAIDAALLAKLCLDGELSLYGRLTGSVEFHKGRVDNSALFYAGGQWFDMKKDSTVDAYDGVIYQVVRNGFASGLLRYLESSGGLTGFDPAYSLTQHEEESSYESFLLDLANGLLFKSDDESVVFVRQSVIANAGWNAFLAMNFGLLLKVSDLMRAFGSLGKSAQKLSRTSTQSINKQLQVLGAMAQAMIESGSKGASEDATLILRKLESKGFGDVVSQKTLTRYLTDAYEQI